MRSIPAALLGLSIAFVPGGMAVGQTAAPAPPESEHIKVYKNPIIFYLARGEPDSCGPGCSKWIAAEGEFDAGAVARFRAFLAKNRADNLPIYIHSPGGLANRAFEIGRLIRARGMTVGVSGTVPDVCRSLDEKACNAAKRSESYGQAVPAKLTPYAICGSACVFVLAAGKVRQVPPGAKVGVHSSRSILLRADGRFTVNQKVSQAQINAGELKQRSYFREMGIDPRLQDIASKTPHDSVRYLSREEIASLGIDKREFLETRWRLIAKPLSARKAFIEAKGPGRQEFRTSFISLSCRSGKNVGLFYMRGLASDESSTKQYLRLEFAGRKIVLEGPVQPKQPNDFGTGHAFDYWIGLQSLDLLDQVAAQKDFEIVFADTPMSADSLRPAIKLSTGGLSQAIGEMREQCGAPLYSGAATLNPWSNPMPNPSLKPWPNPSANPSPSP